MKKSISTFIYSKKEPFELRSDKFHLLIRGTPTSVSDSEKEASWREKLVDVISSTSNRPEDEISSILKETTGLFSLVIRTDNEVILASDIVRYYPLFYGIHNDSFFVTDNLDLYQKEAGLLEIDNKILEEFIFHGLVFKNKTIYKNVYGLQAGEVVAIRDEAISSDRYFGLWPPPGSEISEEVKTMSKEFDQRLQQVFSRMIKITENVNRWVIPLSGGHDSRLIVNYLHRIGVKNVICFSYGRANNDQAIISKQVADAVGYEWHFVEFTEQKWAALNETKVLDNYLSYACNGVSTPHLQDFLAVHQLHTNGVLKPGDIFLPGHTAVTTSTCSKETMKLRSPEEAINFVCDHTRKMSKQSEPPNSLYEVLKDIYQKANVKPGEFYAYAHWNHFTSKYIVNSLRTYEFFGYESRLPLWDREIVDYWFKIPGQLRVKRKFLFATEDYYSLVNELKTIPFMKYEKKQPLLKVALNFLKAILPASIKVKLIRTTKRKISLNEGLNQRFALKADSLKELIEPIEDFPASSLKYFQEYLHRFPYQMNPYHITTLYTVRMLLDKQKNKVRSNM